MFCATLFTLPSRNVPMFCATLFAGGFSGYLLEAFCPEHGPKNSELMWFFVGCCSVSSPIGLWFCRHWIDPNIAAEERRLGWWSARGEQSSCGVGEFEATLESGVDVGFYGKNGYGRTADTCGSSYVRGVSRRTKLGASRATSAFSSPGRCTTAGGDDTTDLDEDSPSPSELSRSSDYGKLLFSSEGRAPRGSPAGGGAGAASSYMSGGPPSRTPLFAHGPPASGRGGGQDQGDRTLKCLARQYMEEKYGRS